MAKKNSFSKSKLDKGAIVWKNWKETSISASEAWEELTGSVYAEDTARKYLNGLKDFLDSGKESRLAGKKIKTGITETKNSQGQKVYTYTSDMLIQIQDLDNKSPDEVMILHGYDPLKWDLKNADNKAWNGASKEQGTYTLYSSSIKVAPSECNISFKFIEEMFRKLKVPHIEDIEYTNVGQKLLEIPMMDVHYGKLAWDKESGQDYDLMIADYIYKNTIRDFISRIDKNQIERIIFPIGQDFFNSDDDKGKTNKGTSQDMDSRWEKIFDKGFHLVFWAIEQLKQIAPVEVCYIPGNHDLTTSYYLVYCLSRQYHDSKCVNVDISPKPRKYYEYGNCMIGYSHGEEPKKNLYELMQSEAPEIWGRTKYREFHLGHLHSLRLEEHLGFALRRISAITRPDAWHSREGYIGALQQAQAFIWDKEKGLEQIINSIVENEGD
jgi:hypothetical protein